MDNQLKTEHNSLKKKAISGLFYRFSERILAQLVSTVVSIILARLLMPEDYGIIALVTVLISLCNVFVSDGLGTALIQKKDADATDFSTCFWAGAAISSVLYIILFFTAPLIAGFYDNALLVPVFRVMGLRLIVAALNSIQHAYVSKHFQFKKFFFSTLGGTIFSAVVGLYMAYTGFGVWALVAQYLTNSVVDTIVLFFTVKWKPQLLFSFARFRDLFSYAWKLFLSGFLNQFYNELRTLIIAKKYSEEDLAYYNKGYSFPSLIVSNINTSINSVIFPLLAEKKDSPAEMRKIVKRGMGLSSFLLFPMLLGFAAVADTFVEVLLTEKWLSCVIFIQIFCISDMIAPMNSAAANVLRATGRSDLVLKNNICIKIIGVIIIVVTFMFSVTWIAIGAMLASVVALTINLIPLKRLIGYRFKDIVADITPSLLLSLVMGALVYLIGKIEINSVLLLFLQIIAGMVFYTAVSAALRLEQFKYVKNLIFKKFRRKKTVDIIPEGDTK